MLGEGSNAKCRECGAPLRVATPLATPLARSMGKEGALGWDHGMGRLVPYVRDGRPCTEYHSQLWGPLLVALAALPRVVACCNNVCCPWCCKLRLCCRLLSVLCMYHRACPCFLLRANPPSLGMERASWHPCASLPVLRPPITTP